MIRFYYHPTPNPAKVALMLEELGLPYQVIPVDTGKGEQHKPEFRAINPNGKVPAIVDTDGPDGKEARVFDSTAILLYLGHKTGRLIGSAAVARTPVMALVHRDRHRPLLRTGGALSARRFGKARLRDQPLSSRSRTPLRSTQHAFERKGIHRRDRLLDRRYFGVGMAGASATRVAGRRAAACRVSRDRPLVPQHRCAACRNESARGRQGPRV